VNVKFPIADAPGRAVSPLTAARSRVGGGAQGTARPTIVFRASRAAFSLIEVLVAITLLSLIVLALMAVFNSTQTAFRASVTQTDVLEGGRAAMDVMTSDLRQMAPSLGTNGVFLSGYYSPVPVNFYVNTNSNQPLLQSLPGSGAQRTNMLEDFFVLSRGNLNGHPAWIGVGYAVYPASSTDLNPLYRCYMTTNVAAASPQTLFTNFTLAVLTGAITNSSHLLDGVVDLRVHAYDTNGVWMTNGYAFGYSNNVRNTLFLPSALGETGFCMFSNTLPASAEVELGVLEDRTLQRAETWPNGSLSQSNYLAQQAGKVHVFRQRVTIPNVDLSAYQ
jgi:prepilin-type N-terminal cleavage/methylation domain-containing protein